MLKVLSRQPSRTIPAVFLVALGYSYITAVLGLWIGGGIYLIKFAPALTRFVIQFGGGYVIFLVEALYVRFPEPGGRRVTRAGSPTLIDDIETVARQLDAPVPDVVLISSDFNASAIERPRFGIVGAPKRYVIVGMPLLDALPREELRAVIAHELAHLTRRHGRIKAFVARIQTSWQALAVQMGNRRLVGWIFLPFCRWYVPQLQRVARSTSRTHEHESDIMAAKVAGIQASACALVRIEVCGHILKRDFNPFYFRETLVAPRAPGSVLEKMCAFLKHMPDVSALQAMVVRALAQQTDGDDTHPSLADRLRFIGADPDPVLLTTALIANHDRCADTLLGVQRAAKLREDLSARMYGTLTKRWRTLQAAVNVWRADDGSVHPTAEARTAYAQWAASCESPEVAIAAIREVLQESRLHSPVNDRVANSSVDANLRDGIVGPEPSLMLQLGLLMSDYGSDIELEEAIEVLERVAKSDGTYAIAANQALVRLYRRLGRTDSATHTATRIEQLQWTALTTARERFTLRHDDLLEPVILAPPLRDGLVAWLTAQPDVGRAFLVQKQMRQSTDRPVIVLAIQRNVAWYKPEKSREASELCDRALRHVPVDDTTERMVVLVESHRRILRTLRSIPACVLVDRMQGDTWRNWLASSSQAGRRLVHLVRRYRWGFFGLLIALGMARGCGGAH